MVNYVTKRASSGAAFIIGLALATSTGGPALATPAIEGFEAASLIVNPEEVAQVDRIFGDMPRSSHPIFTTTAQRNEDWRFAIQDEREKKRRRRIERLEWTYQVLNVVDAVQTRRFLKRGYREANPIIGKNPSLGKLVAYKATAGVIHYVLIRETAKRSPKTAEIMQYVTVTMQAGAVAWNFETTF